MRIRWMAVLSIALLLYPIVGLSASKPEIQSDPLVELSALVEQDPATALEQVRSLKTRAHDNGQTILAYEATLLEGKALNQLSRHEEAAEVLRPLLNRVSRLETADWQLEVRIIMELSESLIRLSRAADAHLLLQSALKKIPEGADPPFMGELLLMVSRSQLFIGEPKNSAASATDAIEWAINHNNDDLSLRARYALAYAYRNMEDTRLAGRYFQQVTEQAAKMGNARLEILALNEQANVLVMEEKLDEAMRIKQSALKRARETGDPDLIATCLHDLGYVLASAGRYEEALPIFQQCIPLHEQQNNIRGVIMSRINISYILAQIGRVSEALQMGLETLEMVKKNQAGELEETLLLQIIQYLEMSERFDEALQYQQELTEFQRARFERELQEQVNSLEDRHRLVEQETEIRILKQERAISELQMDRQQLLIGSAIAAALLLALLAAFVFRGYRLKQRANRELADLNHRLDELARTDTLTGLSNRRDVMDKLRLFTARCDRTGSPVAILMADIDHFKNVNDSYGHDAGDRVLQEVSRTLREQVRAQDLLARWGGEEFLIALADTNLEGARIAAEKFRLAVELHGSPEDMELERVTITVGVSVYTPDRELEAVITEADNRLYEGKESGRNCVVG